MDPFDEPTGVSAEALTLLVRAQRMLLGAGYRYVGGDLETWPRALVQMQRHGLHVVLGPAAVAHLRDIADIWARAWNQAGPAISLVLVGDLDTRESTIFRFLEQAPGHVAYVDAQSGQFHLRRPRSPWASLPPLLKRRGLRRLLAGRDDDCSADRCRAALRQGQQEALQAQAFHEQARQAAGAARKPMLTYLLMASFVAVFAAMLAVGGPRTLADPSPNLLLRFGADYGFFVAQGQYWRMLTSAFVHIGAIHLLLNLMGMYYFGQPLEYFQGRWRLGAYFLFSVLAGSVASLWRHPMTISAGASGGLFGLVGAMAGMVIRYHHDIPPALRKSLRQWLMTVLLYNAVFLFHPAIDNAAHVGGFIGGLLLALAVGRSPIRRHPVGWAGLAGAVVLLAGLLAAAVHVVRTLNLPMVSP